MVTKPYQFNHAFGLMYKRSLNLCTFLIPCHNIGILQFRETSKFHLLLDTMDISVLHMDPCQLVFPVKVFVLYIQISFNAEKWEKRRGNCKEFQVPPCYVY